MAVFPGRAADAGRVGHGLGQRRPDAPGNRPHRVGQELEQGGGIERFPQQFTGQRQHLEHRAPGRQCAEAQARAVQVLQCVVQQFAARLGQQGDGLFRRLRPASSG